MSGFLGARVSMLGGQGEQTPGILRGTDIHTYIVPSVEQIYWNLERVELLEQRCMDIWMYGSHSAILHSIPRT